MGHFLAFAALLLLLFPVLLVDSRLDPSLRLPSDREVERINGDEDDDVGTRWAVLIAGSSGYGNYRHQVCSAFHILRILSVVFEIFMLFIFIYIYFTVDSLLPC